MNTKEIIDYLRRYRDLKENLETYREERDGVKAISYSFEQPSTVKRDRLVYYIQKIDETVEYMREIEEFVERNFDGFSKRCVYLKYIQCLKLKEISSKTNYSVSYINKTIEKAIKNASKNIKGNKKAQ